MAVETMSPLAELMTRAGASDADRDAWLAERRTGITATEVRDLMLRERGLPSYVRQQELIDRKLGRIPEVGDLSNVPVIRWGKDREPVIAAALRAFGMMPESRVFRHPTNARHLASPDGVTENWDFELEVAEIKTAYADLPPGSDAYAAKGYEFQMQWVMYVLGAVRCLFAVEERFTNESGEFVPGEMHTYWVDRDEALIAELVELADEFLDKLDRQRVYGAPEVVIDEEVDTLALNYLRGLAAEKEGAELKSSSYRQLMERVETDVEFVQESSLARVSFSPAKEEERDVVEVDRVAARAANPELYSRLELAADDVVQAKVALAVVQDAVTLHEQRFAVKTGVELVETKKKALRITAAKGTKETKQ